MKTKLTLFVTAFCFWLQLGHVYGVEQLPAEWRITAGNWGFSDGALLVDSMEG